MAIEIINARTEVIGTTAVLVKAPPNKSVVVVHRGVGSDESTASTGPLHVNSTGGTAVTGATTGEGIHVILSGESYPIVLEENREDFSIIASAANTLVTFIVT